MFLRPEKQRVLVETRNKVAQEKLMKLPRPKIITYGCTRMLYLLIGSFLLVRIHGQKEHKVHQSSGLFDEIDERSLKVIDTSAAIKSKKTVSSFLHMFNIFSFSSLTYFFREIL